MGDGVMTKIIRFLTAGESHGQALGGIVEGLPCGYELDFDFINSELSARQGGFGRGGRMQIEKDKIKIFQISLSKIITARIPRNAVTPYNTRTACFCESPASINL